jgi:hypothetical protein
MLLTPAPLSEARKRSFYARRFTPAERRGLRRLDPLDLAGELELLRVQVLRFATDIESEDDPSARARLLGALTRAVMGIASLARAQALLRRSSGSLSEEIQKALADVDPYLTDED